MKGKYIPRWEKVASFLAGLLFLLLLQLILSCARDPAARESKFLAAGRAELQKSDFNRALLNFQNARQAVSRDAEPYYQIGLAYLGLKQPGSALSSFRKALQLNPAHDGARVRIAALMATSSHPEDVQQATRDLEQVLAASPNDVDALNTLAAAEMKSGSIPSAERHLTRAMALAPKDLRAGIALSKLRMLQKDFAGAEEVLKQLAAQNPSVVAARVALAEFYVSGRMWAPAEQAYRQALGMNSKDAAALIGLAGLLQRAGKAEESGKLYQRASLLPIPENTVYGAFLLRTGKRDLAVREFERLAKAEPANRAVRSRLIAAYLAAGRSSDATRVLRSALQKNPKDIDALLERARLQLSGGKYTDAQTDANAVLQINPNSIEAHKLLAEVYRDQGHSLLERQELSEVVRLSPGDMAPREQLVNLLRGARAYKSALEVVDQTPARDRGTLRWIVQRNWVLVDSGDQSELARGIADGMAKGRSPDLTLQLGILKYEQHNYTAARAAAEALMRRDPQDVRALDLIARCYVAEKQNSLALTRIQKAAVQDPKSAVLQQFVGRFLLFMGRPTEARAAFESARQLAPGSLIPIIALAEMDLQSHQFEEIRRDLGPIVGKNVANSDVKMILAEAELGLGNTARALELYRKVADDEPSNVKALNNTAYLLADSSHETDVALRYAQKAVELAPGSPAEEHTLGWVLYCKGLYSSALPHLQAAADKDPKAEHLYHLAAARFRIGDVREARQALMAAMKLDPNSPAAAVAQLASGQARR